MDKKDQRGLGFLKQRLYIFCCILSFSSASFILPAAAQTAIAEKSLLVPMISFPHRQAFEKQYKKTWEEASDAERQAYKKQASKNQSRIVSTRKKKPAVNLSSQKGSKKRSKFANSKKRLPKASKPNYPKPGKLEHVLDALNAKHKSSIVK